MMLTDADRSLGDINTRKTARPSENDTKKRPKIEKCKLRKTLLIPDFEILWGEWGHIELKSWLDRSSGTFCLYGCPLRPVVCSQ